MTARHAQSLGTRLDALASFLPIFEAPSFAFTRNYAPGEATPGDMMMCPTVLSEAAEQFVKTAYAGGWVISDFGWPSWKGTPEAFDLRDDPEVLKQATHVQLAKLLTVLIRQERFVNGTLARAYDSGLLTAVLRRAEELRSEVVKKGH